MTNCPLWNAPSCGPNEKCKGWKCIWRPNSDWLQRWQTTSLGQWEPEDTISMPKLVRINKLTSVFLASVLLLIMNFVMTLSEWLWILEAIAEWIRRLLWYCFDGIHCQSQDRRMKNWRPFVFYDNRKTKLHKKLQSLINLMRPNS